MNRLATLALITVLALPAHAGVIHNEAVNGDLSTNAAAPTPLAFALGGNTVIGSVTSGAGADPRDYITFTIPAGHALMQLKLLAYSPPGLSFAAFNAGQTSYIPSVATDPLFLSGIHIGGADFGMDLMPFFVDRNVTSNALPSPMLPLGDYCFMIQQANTTVTSYSLEFVVESVVPTRSATWGMIKNLYK